MDLWFLLLGVAAGGRAASATPCAGPELRNAGLRPPAWAGEGGVDGSRPGAVAGHLDLERASAPSVQTTQVPKCASSLRRSSTPAWTTAMSSTSRDARPVATPHCGRAPPSARVVRSEPYTNGLPSRSRTNPGWATGSNENPNPLCGRGALVRTFAGLSAIGNHYGKRPDAVSGDSVKRRKTTAAATLTLTLILTLTLTLTLTLILIFCFWVGGGV